MPKLKKRAIVIGGGIIGTAIAYKLSREEEYDIHLVEKESNLAKHQTGNNSGVLHCGLYYKTGSLKAKLAVEGIRKMVDFCKEHEIAYDLCGKVVAAVDNEGVGTLEKLADNGKRNGLKGLTFLNKTELKIREPHLRAQKALLVPEEGIVDYVVVTNKMASLFKEAGGKISLNTKIEGITTKDTKSYATTSNGENYEYDLIINCTGLYTDRTFKSLTQQKSPLKIVPFRGEYMSFKESYKDMVNHLIYPVPNIKYPFLGVHFTRMIDGSKEVGPNAVLAFKREGYNNKDFSFTDTMDSLSYSGFQNFLRKNFSFSMKELSTSLSMSSFVKKAKRMMPDLNETMLVRDNAGVRAQAMSPAGELIMDFKIERIGNQVHLLNAPSPGATASLAIASYVINNYINSN